MRRSSSSHCSRPGHRVVSMPARDRLRAQGRDHAVLGERRRPGESEREVALLVAADEGQGGGSAEAGHREADPR